MYELTGVQCPNAFEEISMLQQYAFYFNMYVVSYNLHLSTCCNAMCDNSFGLITGLPAH